MSEHEKPPEEEPRLRVFTGPDAGPDAGTGARTHRSMIGPFDSLGLPFARPAYDVEVQMWGDGISPSIVRERLQNYVEGESGVQKIVLTYDGTRYSIVALVSSLNHEQAVSDALNGICEVFGDCAEDMQKSILHPYLKDSYSLREEVGSWVFRRDAE